MPHCADLPRPTPVVFIAAVHWDSPAAPTRAMAQACAAQRDVLVVEPPRFLDDAAYPMLHIVQPTDCMANEASDVAHDDTPQDHIAEHAPDRHALVRVIPLLPRRLLTESAATMRDVWTLIRSELLRWRFHDATLAERFESPQYWCCLPEALTSVRDVFGDGALLREWRYGVSGGATSG